MHSLTDCFIGRRWIRCRRFPRVGLPKAGGLQLQPRVGGLRSDLRMNFA